MGLTDTWRSDSGQIKHRTKLGREVVWDDEEARETLGQLVDVLQGKPVAERYAVQIALAPGSHHRAPMVAVIANDLTMWLRPASGDGVWRQIQPLPQERSDASSEDPNCGVSPSDADV